MDQLISALAPIFAAGLGIQQLGEILSPLLDKISTEYKKFVFGLISLTLGLAVALQFDLHVINLLLLEPCNVTRPFTKFLDSIITGLIISGGTEGVNSILKFMKFKKEESKNEAARTAASVKDQNEPSQTKTALDEMNKK